MRINQRYSLSEHRRQRIVPLVVFAVSAVVTATLYVFAHNYVAARDQLRIESEISKVETAIRTRMATYAKLIKTTAANFANNGVPSPEGFERYAQTIGIASEYPGLQGLGYADCVHPTERAGFLARVRKTVRPDYSIYPEPKGDATPVLMLHPINDLTRRVIGFDLESTPPRVRAMDRAKQTGQVSLSALTTSPVQTAPRPAPGFALYAPVYIDSVYQGAPPEDRDVHGFVYAGFRAYRLFGDIFSSKSGIDLWVSIHDGNSTKKEDLLFQNVPWGEGQSGAIRRPLDIYGRRWTIEYVPKAGMVQTAGEGIVRWIPLCGLLIGLLLAGLSYSQVRANDALLRQADELQRREFHQSLLSRASAALAGSHDLGTTYGLMAEIIVPSFADRCTVDLVEDSRLRRLVLVTARGESVLASRDLDDAPNLDDVPDSVLNGVGVQLQGVTPEVDRLMSYAVGGGTAALPPLSGVISVPIVSQGTLVGAISFGLEKSRKYNEEDLRLANQLAARAAVAFEGSRLFSELEREIGERRIAEAKVREVNENLERLVEERTRELVAANNELEAFCYSVSHDLRGPLRSVDGFSRALREDYGDRLDPEGLEFIERVRRAAKRMDELISALLSLSRLTRAELNQQHVNVTAVAEEVMKDALRSHDGIRFEIAPGLAAQADARMVRILFDNLLGNAVKFSSASPAPRVQVGFEDGAFFVRDNGVGFNMQYVNKLFVPFERLHPTAAYPGTGIGLATVQRIVARHGGRVWAEGIEGEGATFYFTLPVAEA